MKSKFPIKLTFLLPLIVILSGTLIWFFICKLQLVPAYQLPSPIDVLRSLKEEIIAGRLYNDIIASLWRVTIGFVISAFLGIPFGLWLGQNMVARKALFPILNFFRFLSPLSWIPFAILWFHIGDKPAIFLLIMATFFPLVISTMTAVAGIPSIFFHVAKDYNYTGRELLTKVTFPAVLPQIITAMRVCYGIAWVVIVASEMVGCRDGLGFGIWDARNALRLDTAVSYMLVIGLLGLLMDRILSKLSKMPNVRWGYDR